MRLKKSLYNKEWRKKNIKHAKEYDASYYATHKKEILARKKKTMDEEIQPKLDDLKQREALVEKREAVVL